MPRYEFILLDADRTLFDFDMAEDRALTATLLANNLPCSEKIKAVYREENDKAWALFEDGKVTKAQLTILRFERFMERVGIQGDGASLNKQYIVNLSTQCIPLQGAEEVCRQLSKHCRLFIVTNGIDKVQKGRMSRCSFKDCFEAMFVSEAIGYQKPQKEYFEIATSRISGFDPAKAIVVGDSPASDILGANNAGLDSCWYNPKGETLPGGITATYTIKDLYDLPAIILK